MKLTEEDLLNFQKIYKNKFGKVLNKQEILEKAGFVITLFKNLQQESNKRNENFKYNNN